MKKRSLLCFVCVAMLFSLASCAKTRYTVTVEDQIFEVRGSAKRAKQVAVLENDKTIWKKSVKIDKSVGDRGGDYGFVATDLNFDGKTDLMIADNVSGECTSYTCYLQNPDGGFTYSEALSKLYNIRVKPETQALLAFSHNTEYISKQDHIITDAATQFVWKDGTLTPERRVSLAYYSETKA